LGRFTGQRRDAQLRLALPRSQLPTPSHAGLFTQLEREIFLQGDVSNNDNRDLFCVIALVPHQLQGKVDPRR